MQPHVLFVLAGTEVGGAERYTLRLTRHLVGRARVTIVARSSRPGTLAPAFTEAGAEVKHMPMGYLNPRRMLETYRLFAALSPDTVCDMTGIFAGIPLALAGVAGVPQRIAFHRRSTPGYGSGWSARMYARFSTLLMERAATAILSNSAMALEVFHPGSHRTDPRMQVIPNLLDPSELQLAIPSRETRQALGIPADAFIVLHVGRLDSAKDHRTLLAAMSAVLQRNPQVHLVLAGRGTEKLRGDGGHPLAAHPRFHPLGNRDDVPDLLAASDLFVFPSVTEGQPNSLLEAMVSGLPVVTTDIPTIRAAVPDYAHRDLVPPGAIDFLSSAVERCITSGDERKRRCYQRHASELTNPESILPRLTDLLFGTETQR
jgi:glycosyltransferase involved in cell wall biosynthesis